MLSGKVPNKRRSLYKKEPRNMPGFSIAWGGPQESCGLEMVLKQHCCLFTSHYFLEVILSIWQPPWRLCTGGWFCMWTPKAAIQLQRALSGRNPTHSATPRAGQPLQLMERDEEESHPASSLQSSAGKTKANAKANAAQEGTARTSPDSLISLHFPLEKFSFNEPWKN